MSLIASDSCERGNIFNQILYLWSSMENCIDHPSCAGARKQEESCIANLYKKRNKSQTHWWIFFALSPPFLLRIPPFRHPPSPAFSHVQPPVGASFCLRFLAPLIARAFFQCAQCEVTNATFDDANFARLSILKDKLAEGKLRNFDLTCSTCWS